MVGEPSRILERVPQLRRLTNAAGLQRVLSIARHQRLVRERAAFVRRELRGGVGEYRLVQAPERRVVLRHRTRDIDIFARTP
jgi:hypothetical protein